VSPLKWKGAEKKKLIDSSRRTDQRVGVCYPYRRATRGAVGEV